MAIFILWIEFGDTFRWKGENVATSEVAAAITTFPGIVEACVYGVQVPATEGAAGMATIASPNVPDLQRLREHLVNRLPDYARPVFLRVTDNIESTATFKQSKITLKSEGYNPGSTSDPIFFYSSKEQAFVRLDLALFEQINAGKIRL